MMGYNEGCSQWNSVNLLTNAGPPDAERQMAADPKIDEI